MLARIDGRMYYNLGNWYRLLSLLPFFSSNRQHMETMMGVAEPLPDEVMAGIAPTTGLGLRGKDGFEAGAVRPSPVTR